MAKIEIYARMRPTNREYDGFKVTTDPESKYEHILVQTAEQNRQVSTPSKRSRSQAHNFQFKRVFQETATQEEVFESVSKNIIDSFLEGYNGTVFAYGQTSSGKTHTIEGGGRKFADRGIIPRSLSYVYKEVEKLSSRGEDVSVHISYMEIYQDTGYDLLNPGTRPGALMVTLPKINISEGPGGRIVVRNLSSHLAATEEVAQSLLFQGSTCRKVAETSMNQCSSRSHSIFTVTLTTKTPNAEVITRSKLNLVDLAGSERVSKTGADGKILQEAKHINLSLHHLEHVIVTLQSHLRSSHSQSMLSPSHSHHSVGLSSRKSRERSLVSPQSPKSREGQSPNTSRPSTRGTHVPYRNCMLTMVLKDSLGGNCLTAMIATISIEEANLGETISTLRFSQRVACISNKARKNEELDDKAIIRKLKRRIAELENEVLLLKGQGIQQEDSGVSLSPTCFSSSQSLTDQEKIACHQILHNFFHGKIDNPVTAGINTAVKFHECLQVLKMVVLQALGISKQSPSTSKDPASTHAKELASQVKHSLQTTIPSPNSRLSSGFGSLVDTDGSCESSHNQDTLSIPSHVHQQPTIQASPSPLIHTSPPSVKEQLFEQRNQTKVERQYKQSRRSEPHAPMKATSPLKSHSPSEQQKTVTHVRAYPSPVASERSPRHTNRAWMSPVVSPSSSQLSTADSYLSPTPTKPLSPRQENDVQHLLVKQEELKRSKHERKKLANQVQLLDLHVEEEKLKSELNLIGEQLAQQHAMVTRLQKTDSNWEQLCAERIAEQQLRIKQAKIHQRLMDVHYYIQSSQRPPPPPTPHLPVKVWTAPAAVGKSHHSSKVQRELEKQEIKQTQVDSHIEKLRMSQMEKQLELKEVSTRRKILALKQQLLAGRNTTDSRPHTDDSLQARSQSTQSFSAPQAESRQETNNHLHTTTNSQGNSNERTAVTHSTITPQLRYDPESPLSRIRTTDSRTEETQSSQTPNSRTAQPDSSHNIIKSPEHSLRVETSRKVIRTPDKIDARESPTVIKSPPVKLTLPDEVKETEYMTAIQRQKARVSRIRRCIVAATLIQRAWRTHKQ